MQIQVPKLVSCRELGEFDRPDLAAVRGAFSDAEECTLQQAWLSEPETDFMPTVARMGWRGNSLLIFAEMLAADVFTHATDHNQRFWELGDTFEIFLQPRDQKSYVEFHIAPNNLRLQLRFSNFGFADPAHQAGSFKDKLVHDELFYSWTWMQATPIGWLALAEIPAGSILEKGRRLLGSKWMFSLCRYDYLRGRKAPVISSTSAHTRPDFHSREHWGELHFI